MFKFQCSKFGTDKEILLKARRNLPVFLDTLSRNLCLVRVHAFVARELPLLQSQNLSLRFSTSSVQSVQAYVDNPQEAAGPQASSSASWSFGRSVAGWTHIEKSRPALRPYPSRIELAFSSKAATVRIAIAAFALAKRTFGFGLGRTLLSLSRKRLGLVCDGGQAVPSKSRHFPRSCSLAWQREYAGLVSGLHNDPRLHSQTHQGFGLRRDFRNYQPRHKPRLDRAALPFSSHQPLAELPRPTQSQLGRQTLREALYQQVRKALELPDGPRLQNVLKKLRRLIRKATGLRVMRMIVREFLRRIDHFRAYRKYPKLNLPTTTGSVEAMNRRVRDLMRQTRSIRTPQALHLWATALIRKRPNIMCNGKNFQQN
jgi:hypothetical protein